MSIKIEGRGSSKENVFSDSDSGMPLWNGAPLLNLVYPVGSIYWSSKNINPGTLFGGTWVQIKDRFILAAGDYYSNGATGGAATVTLSVSNMPSHSHSFTPSGEVGSHSHSFTPSGNVSSHSHTGPSHTHSFTPSGTVSSSFSGTAGNTGAAGTGNTGATTPSFTGTAGYTGDTAPSFSGTAGYTGSNGSGTSFSILPPYVVKYCWERTA